MTSIHSDLKEQIERVVHEVKTELKTEFIAMLNKKVVSLEAHVEARENEVFQDIASTLEELKATVVAVHENRERMWQAIDGMTKEDRSWFRGMLTWMAKRI